MALNFRCIKNKSTGQVLNIEAGRFGNFKNCIKKRHESQVQLYVLFPFLQAIYS